MDDMRGIIDKCKRVKIEKGYSFQYISEMTGIPKSTVERVFSSSGTSCRYDTIYPIARFLVGFDEPTPEPKDMPLPPTEMIDLYKEAVAKRESDAEKMKEEHRAEVAELKEEHKQRIEDLKKEYIAEIERKRRCNIILSIVIAIMISIISILAVIDLSHAGIGWFR